LYTIKWTGLQPTEEGWSPPSDTKQPHAQGCRDLFAFLAAVIAKMHARGAVHVLTLCGAGRRQHSGESPNAFTGADLMSRSMSAENYPGLCRASVTVSGDLPPARSRVASASSVRSP
jgi:hypothetical protein